MNYLGLTMGDPAGIGCEVVLKALTNEEFRKKSVLFGSIGVINHYHELLKIEDKVKVITDMDEFDENFINVVDVIEIGMDDFKTGEVSAICGDAAYRYVEQAIKWSLEGKLKGVVTGPLNKESLHLGGHKYDGHTEIFATLTDTDKYAMLLWSEDLKVIHVSTHVSLRVACDNVKTDRVLETIMLANDNLINMGIENPRIAVAGLNPHSGESGIFGSEEIDEIEPAIKMAIDKGLDVEGPIAPDTVFLRASQGQFDIVIAMYHDQGHIPMKMLAFDAGVNITLGLPIIRTSVDHGTAFEIAGKGIAREESMVQAIIAAGYFKE